MELVEEWPDMLTVIWQMGKVGSTSIEAALSAAGISATRIHYMNPDRINTLRKEHIDRRVAVPDHVLAGEHLSSLIGDQGKPVRVISLVRDPVARNLGALFESWNEYPPACNNTNDVEELYEYFCSKFDYSTLEWFETEFSPILGINIYDLPFNHKYKNLIANINNIKILILRCEDSDLDKEKSLNSFLNRNDIVLPRLNLSRDKPQGHLWKAMQRDTKVPIWLLERAYESRLVRHFYTPGEIECFRNKWLAGKRRSFTDHVSDSVSLSRRSGMRG